MSTSDIVRGRGTSVAESPHTDCSDRDCHKGPVTPVDHIAGMWIMSTLPWALRATVATATPARPALSAEASFMIVGTHVR